MLFRDPNAPTQKKTAAGEYKNGSQIFIYLFMKRKVNNRMQVFGAIARQSNQKFVYKNKPATTWGLF